MANFDDDADNKDDDKSASKVNKKIFFIIVPTLIIIAGALSIFSIFNRSDTPASEASYNVVKKPLVEGQKSPETIVFFDLPEVTVQIRDGSGDRANLRIKLNMELSNPDDIKMIDAFVPRITDAVISHTIELNTQEVNGVGNLYWLKEELLRRINLLTDPIKINNLNFKVFEIIKA